MNDAYTTVDITLRDGDFYPDVAVYDDHPPIFGAWFLTVRLSIYTRRDEPVTVAQVETMKRFAEAAAKYATELEKWVKPSDAGDLDPLADDDAGGGE